MISVYRDLSDAYYSSGEFDNAINLLNPIIKSKQADEHCFQTMVSCLMALDERKKAKAVVQSGLELYPRSGLMYDELGKLYESDGDSRDAIDTWLHGLQVSPNYYMNYFELSRIYIAKSNFVMSLVYGEIFVNLERNGTKADEARKIILSDYQRLFYLPDNVTPKYKNRVVDDLPFADNFEDAVKNTLIKLSAIMDDGLNMENLIMLRTRFAMEWQVKYAKIFPHSLFIYQLALMKVGFYDAYNQWLLAKAISKPEFDMWDKFHSSSITQFEIWAETEPLKPVSTDFYDETGALSSPINRKK
jgi:tetratricopeptide (TPR) repeat protein